MSASIYINKRLAAQEIKSSFRGLRNTFGKNLHIISKF